MTEPVHAHPTLAQMLIGKTKEVAEDMLARACARWRIREEGAPVRDSMEYIATRYNLFFKDGKIDKVTMG